MAFKDASKELKRIGKGAIHSYPEIEHAGSCSFCLIPVILNNFLLYINIISNIIKLLNNNFHCFRSTQAVQKCPIESQSLQDKVQFDIRFYFVCRANENIDKFTKKTFNLELDANTGIQYIKKNIDEQTKNHQLDTEMINASMPELPNSNRYPVNNFITYLSKLHPRCKYLWQQPKKLEDALHSDIWYKPAKIALSGYMSRISHDADLSRVYTNHSILSTATTFLGRANFSLKQIMSVTGHRSPNSLAVYQKVSQNGKLQMGLAMNLYLQTDLQLSLPPVQQTLRPIAPKAVTATATASTSSNQTVEKFTKNDTPDQQLVRYEPEDPLLQDDFPDDMNVDIQALLQDIEQDTFSVTQVETNTSSSMTLQRQTVKKSQNVPCII